MFKNCTKSVCPTSSIDNGPNPKKVSVIQHSKTDKIARNSFPTQGTNLWLKNGGVLPLVSVDPTSNEIPTSSKHVKQSVQNVKSCIASKQRTKPHGEKHLSGHTKASLRSIHSKHGKECKRDESFMVDKENYMNILVSHFNEQSHADVYNPDEFSETKNKASAPSSSNAKSTLQAPTPPEEIHYSEKAKAEILCSIREELRLWKCDVELNDGKVLEK